MDAFRDRVNIFHVLYISGERETHGLKGLHVDRALFPTSNTDGSAPRTGFRYAAW